MIKTWKYLDNENCPDCGQMVEIYTAFPLGWACDGDLARCSECGKKGWMSTGYVDWCGDYDKKKPLSD